MTRRSMRPITFFCLAVAGLWAALSSGGCSDGQAKAHTPGKNDDHANVSQPAAPKPDCEDQEAAAKFSDILTGYQALNARLDEVSARLQIANAPLCPVTIRHPGYNVHTLADYPQELQTAAQAFLRVGEGLSIRSVRPGSPAAAAGILPADRLIGLDGRRFAGGDTQMQFYAQAARRAFANPRTVLTLARPNRGGAPDILSVELSAQTLCDYPAHVVFDAAMNGHTDGRVIWITSALMRSVADDASLALIVAHEMAHAISGHIQGRSSKELELQADRMALVMMARADMKTGAAIAYWTRADMPQNQWQSASKTHPSLSERLANFETARTKIEAAQARGDDVDFRTVNAP